MSDNTLESPETETVFATTQSLMQQILNPHYLNNSINLPQNNITSGFRAIDAITKGFQNGELVTIAVRPGIGKTSFMLSMVNNIALNNNYACGIFSLERKSEKLVQRIIQSNTGINLDKINSEKITEIEKNHVNTLAATLNNATIFFDDQIGISTDTVAEKARLMKNAGAQIIFVDNLELIHSNNSIDKCEDNDLCATITDLQQLAKELNIPIVLFSILKKPIIYKNKYKYTPDYVNENSNTLIFLNRPSYYHINQIDKTPEDEVEITIAKNINIGEMVMAKLRIIESLGQYKDID